MFKVSGLLLFIAISILILSCQDISKFRDNYDKEALTKSVMSKDDSLSFITVNSVDLGTVKKPRFKYFDLVFENLSERLTINIYSLKCSNGLKLSSLSPLFLTLAPGRSNKDYPLSLNLNSSAVNDGPYEEKIYINQSETRYITVKAMIIK